MSGVLYGTRPDSTPMPGSPLSPEFTITGRTDGGDRDNLRDALLFRLPLSWRNGTVHLRAVVNDGHSVAEDNYANNEWPEPIDFHTSHTLCINMVRVHLHPRTSTIDDAGFWDMVEFLRRWYPVADVAIYRGHTVYPYWHGFGSEWYMGDDIEWALEKVWDYDSGHSDPDECDDIKYMGMMHPDSFNGGTPGHRLHEPGRGRGVMSTQRHRPLAEPLRRAHHGPRDRPQPGPRARLLHRQRAGRRRRGLGLSLPGAPTPAASRPWVTPPPTTAGTGRCWAVTFEVITASEAADLMSYNWKRFPSDYTYRAFMGRLDLAAPRRQPACRRHGPRPASTCGPRASSPCRRTRPGCRLLPPGHGQAAHPARILPAEHGGGQHLQPGAAWAPAMPCSTPTPSAPLAVTDQGEVRQWSFSARSFPYNPATQRIVLYRDGVELGSRPVSPSAPVVTITRPVDGAAFTSTMDIAWSGSDPDGDAPLAYSVLYSGDDGATWSPIASGIYSNALQLLDLIDLPGSGQARIRVLATDGVNTGQAMTGRFSVAPHPPEPHITLPRNGSTLAPATPLVLTGLAIDTEDGQITDTARLTWTVDISGVVGTGKEWELAGLPAGRRVITLTAQDSNGQTGSTSVTVFVLGQKNYLPVVVRQ